MIAIVSSLKTIYSWHLSEWEKAAYKPYFFTPCLPSMSCRSVNRFSEISLASAFLGLR